MRRKQHELWYQKRTLGFESGSETRDDWYSTPETDLTSNSSAANSVWHYSVNSMPKLRALSLPGGFLKSRAPLLRQRFFVVAIMSVALVILSLAALFAQLPYLPCIHAHILLAGGFA